MTAPTRPTGLPCPECGTLIRIDLEALLECDDFACPGCGLAITLDRSRSAEALAAAEKVVEAMREMQQVKDRWK